MSKADYYETPLGRLTIDKAVVNELENTGKFQEMTLDVDEREHSIELQLPFIAKVMYGHEYTVVPVLVGNLFFQGEVDYGLLFGPYLADPDNLFVISSDFCHWGLRFRHQYMDPDCKDIGESIEKVDRRGMELIAAEDVMGFATYLQQTKNTICGRHPIAILMNVCAFAILFWLFASFLSIFPTACVCVYILSFVDCICRVYVWMVCYLVLRGKDKRGESGGSYLDWKPMYGIVYDAFFDCLPIFSLSRAGYKQNHRRGARP